MFVANQPSVPRPLKTIGRTYPGSGLLPVHQDTACSAKPKRDRDIPAHHNLHVANFQREHALPAIEPLQEPPAERSSSGVLERRYSVEIDNVWRIERHE